MAINTADLTAAVNALTPAVQAAADALKNASAGDPAVQAAIDSAAGTIRSATDTLTAAVTPPAPPTT